MHDLVDRTTPGDRINFSILLVDEKSSKTPYLDKFCVITPENKISRIILEIGSSEFRIISKYLLKHMELSRVKKLKISAVTFFVKNMDLAVKFYSNIPGFEMVYGNSETEFVTFKIEDQFLNLEHNQNGTSNFGRIILHVNDVDKTYHNLKQSAFSDRIETVPTDASWGERFFYIRDPDNHQIAIAKPL